MRIDGSLPMNPTDLQQKRDEVKTQDFENLLQQAKENNDEKKLMDACKQFEAVFVNMLLKNMRNTIPDGGFIEKSYQREVFEGMLDEKLAEQIAGGQGIGLARQMYNQMARSLKVNSVQDEE
ncbi:MAG: rod-binding protein [Thermotaleaceae bacterium]